MINKKSTFRSYEIVSISLDLSHNWLYNFIIFVDNIEKSRALAICLQIFLLDKLKN